MSSLGSDLSGISQVLEPMFVQTVVSEGAVKALDKRILHRLAGLDDMQFCAGLLTPEEHRFTRQFAAVVADQNLG